MKFKLVVLFFISIFLVSCSEYLPWQEYFLSTIDADGNNLKHLVKDVFGVPKFSQDGEKIIIANNQGFWTVNSDGTDYICILDSLDVSYNHFSISPISEKLIFFQQGEIYQLDYINGDFTKLFIYENEGAWFPSFSPDGSKILFSTTSIGQGDSTIVKMYSMNEDGTNQNLLYQNSSPYFSLIRYPTFSNDMEKIYFVYGGLVCCNYDGTDIELIVSGNISMSSCPISISTEYVVYTDYIDMFSYNIITGVILNLGNGDNPNISPDGTQITFDDYDLYTINIDGSNRTKIAESSGRFQSFSPDGEKIVFYGQIDHSRKKDNNPLE